jgi:hypothetical protein
MALNWASNFAVALIFPLMDAGLGDYSFLPFAGALCLFLLLTVVFVPETKGRTIEDITQSYAEFDQVASGKGSVNSNA